MAREIFYTYSASAVPPDPTVNITKYTSPLSYAAGYYKAIARDGGELSTVTSQSFGIAPTDYVAYYMFNNNYLDETGNNNIVTLQSIPFTTGHDGQANHAASIDTRTSYLALPNNNISTENMSVSMWYYYNGLGDYSALLYSKSAKSPLIINNTGVIGFYNDGFFGSGITLTTNQYYHIVIVCEGINYKLYIDGNLVFTSSSMFNLSINKLSTIANFPLGALPQGALGRIDNLRIYQRMIDQSEITTIFNLG